MFIRKEFCMALRFEQKVKIWKEKYGDFSPEVKAMLKTLVDEISKTKAKEPCSLKKIVKKGVTKTGSFIREYNGRAHEVFVKGEKEFIYDGETYTSLSAIAFKITGTKWNGKRFFGAA